MGKYITYKIIFMTGATSGLGKISALKSAADGATVIVLARNKDKGLKLTEEYKLNFPAGQGKIELIEGNLSSFQSIVKACKEVTSKYPIIDMVVNNAGIMNFDPLQSKDGIEETFQVNLLAPILICNLLYDQLKKSKGAKIIFTSSALHQGDINFDNLEFKDNYGSLGSYRQSKLGVILICRTLAESLRKHHINIYAQHPGIVRTELGRNARWFSKVIFNIMGKSPEKGSQTLSYLIETDPIKLQSGAYYANKKETKTTPQSYDIDMGKKLIEVVQTYLDQHLTPNDFLSID